MTHSEYGTQSDDYGTQPAAEEVLPADDTVAQDEALDTSGAGDETGTAEQE